MRVTQIVMGMPVTIDVLIEAAVAEDLLRLGFDYFHHVDAVFSTYKSDSEISRLNRGEIKAEDCSNEVREVLAKCAEMKSYCDGYFDIVHNGQIDPSGLVKGWAIWNAAEILNQAGVQNYLIEAGGDMQIKGRNSQGELWRVGIRHPIEHSRLAKRLQLTNCAVATSGTYERGQHIYNPKSGQAISGLLSLSAVGPSIYEVDVLTTAAFAMGRAGLSWLKQQGLEAFMITQELETFATAGWKALEIPHQNEKSSV